MLYLVQHGIIPTDSMMLQLRMQYVTALLVTAFLWARWRDSMSRRTQLERSRKFYGSLYA